MIIIALIAGATINPVAIGISPVNKTIIAEKIREINESDDGEIWIASSSSTGQYLIANGVNCLNGIHTYPNYKWLKVIDPEKKYDEVYNRYAHIAIILGEETKFKLAFADSYIVTLTKNDIEKLGVKYYYTTEKCSENIINEFGLSEKYIDNEKGQYIYSFEY